MDLEIRQLEDNIIELLNQSTVCNEAKRLILADVLRIVTKEADKAIVEELKSKGEQNGV